MRIWVFEELTNTTVYIHIILHQLMIVTQCLSIEDYFLGSNKYKHKGILPIYYERTKDQLTSSETSARSLSRTSATISFLFLINCSFCSAIPGAKASVISLARCRRSSAIFLASFLSDCCQSLILTINYDYLLLNILSIYTG